MSPLIFLSFVSPYPRQFVGKSSCVPSSEDANYDSCRLQDDLADHHTISDFDRRRTKKERTKRYAILKMQYVANSDTIIHLLRLQMYYFFRLNAFYATVRS